MRLINAYTHELVEFFDADIPPYAILSHKWGSADEELSYSDYIQGRKRDSAGWKKIEDFCRVAGDLNYGWAWVDTCCIDKSSSSEQSEAINSMFAWYKAAQLCIVHLADVTDPEDLDQFGKSVWFTRGWTLQELLAPSHLKFYTADWQYIASKDSHKFAGKVSQVTGIPQRMLKSPDILHNVSVARRMSWAAGRQTSRTEDIAYCLLGIFDINMPLLYGEGHKAFYRLQMEIMEQLDDESLFAWQDETSTAESATHGLLAKSPAKFALCGHVVSTQTPSRLQSPPIHMTSRGAEVFSELSETYSSTTEGQSIFVYELGCGTSDSNSYCLDMQVGGNVLRQGKVRPCSIALSRRSEGAAFTRIDAGRPMSEITSKYVHATYIRPARFYIQTSWSGAASFSRIYTGRMPRHRAEDSSRAVMVANQLTSSLSVSTPHRTTSAKARLLALREEASFRLSQISDAPLERKSSDQSDEAATPIYASDMRDKKTVEMSKRLAELDELIPQIDESLDEFAFASPEILQTAGISRNISRRKQRLETYALGRSRAVPSQLDKPRSESSSHEDVEEAIEAIVADSPRPDNAPEPIEAIAGQLSRPVEAAEEDASPINSDLEANRIEAMNAAPVMHDMRTVQIVAAQFSNESQDDRVSPDTSPTTPRYQTFLKRSSERKIAITDAHPDLPLPSHNRVRIKADHEEYRRRSSPISPSSDTNKVLHRKRRNSSIKVALLAEQSIEDLHHNSDDFPSTALERDGHPSNENDTDHEQEIDSL